LKFLTQHCYNFWFQQLCPEIIYNTLIVQEFIQSTLKCVSGVSRNNQAKQTIRKLNFSKSYLTCDI